MNKLINISADTPEELCQEFIKAMSAVGEISVQDSASGKPYGKLLVNVPFTPRGGSYVAEWPDDVTVEGKIPASVTLTLILSGLQAAGKQQAAKKAQAATILADIARLQDKARRLGALPKEPNAAGEDGE